METNKIKDQYPEDEGRFWKKKYSHRYKTDVIVFNPFAIFKKKKQQGIGKSPSK
jgi:hypothetical protein